MLTLTGMVHDPIIEDGGQAVYVQIDDGNDQGFFVRLHSWVNHEQINKLLGKKIKITIEVIE